MTCVEDGNSLAVVFWTPSSSVSGRAGLSSLDWKELRHSLRRVEATLGFTGLYPHVLWCSEIETTWEKYALFLCCVDSQAVERGSREAVLSLPFGDFSRPNWVKP